VVGQAGAVSFLGTGLRGEAERAEQEEDSCGLVQVFPLS
jgi:hypothetical protein